MAKAGPHREVFRACCFSEDWGVTYVDSVLSVTQNLSVCACALAFPARMTDDSDAHYDGLDWEGWTDVERAAIYRTLRLLVGMEVSDRRRGSAVDGRSGPSEADGGGTGVEPRGVNSASQQHRTAWSGRDAVRCCWDAELILLERAVAFFESKEAEYLSLRESG